MFIYILFYKIIIIFDFADDFNKEAPLQEYPRPNLRRASYLNLNGEWDYAINKTGEFPKIYDGKIVVPYPIESELSGVKRNLKSNEYLFYKLDVFIDKNFRKDIDILSMELTNVLRFILTEYL